MLGTIVIYWRICLFAMNVKRLRTCLFTMNVKRLTFIKMNKYLLPTDAVPLRRSFGADGKWTIQKKLLGESFIPEQEGKWQKSGFCWVQIFLKGFNIWRVTCSTLSQQDGQGTFTQTRAKHRSSREINKKETGQGLSSWRDDNLVRKVKYSPWTIFPKQLTHQGKTVCKLPATEYKGQWSNCGGATVDIQKSVGMLLDKNTKLILCKQS